MYLMEIARFIGHMPQFKGKTRLVNFLVPWKKTKQHCIDVCRLADIKINIDTNSMIERDIYLFGNYEPESIEAIDTLIQKGIASRDQTFLDIGANIGIFSLACAEKFKKVVAIEANPIVYKRLLANIELNHFDNIEPHNIAAGSESKKADFCYPILSNENHGVGGFSEEYMLNAGIKYEKKEIKVCRIDKILGNEKANIGLIKIDVEGYELPALQGLEEIISETYPSIIIEIAEEGQNRLGYTCKDVMDWLLKHNYFVFTEDDLDHSIDQIDNRYTNFVAIHNNRCSKL